MQLDDVVSSTTTGSRVEEAMHRFVVRYTLENVGTEMFFTWFQCFFVTSPRRVRRAWNSCNQQRKTSTVVVPDSRTVLQIVLGAWSILHHTVSSIIKVYKCYTTYCKYMRHLLLSEPLRRTYIVSMCHYSN